MCQACGGVCGARPPRRRGLVLDVNVAGRSLRICDAGGPAPLFVSRALDAVCGAELQAWAQAAGFEGVVAPADMHVTVAYSRASVDWFKFPSWFSADDVVVPKGGPRRVERFGDGLPVLRFASDPLLARWDEFRRGGCSWDYPGYAPHITFASGFGRTDLNSLKPYIGPLRFGPEEFAPLVP